MLLFTRGLSILVVAAIISFSVVGNVKGNSTPQCKPFKEIYNGGKELCENMWNNAFKYESDTSKPAYTMWFFSNTNPNDAISFALNHTMPVTECHLQYYHKDAPGPEPETFTECHPWKDNACCLRDTVSSAQKLKEGYGKEYHWDRCGPLSPECERFFVQEACFYECEPSAGFYRKFKKDIYDEKCDSYHASYDKAYQEATCPEQHNEWQMHGMPINAAYCDAWHTACANDNFCASDSGDFFTCAAEYKAADLNAELISARKREEELQDEVNEERVTMVIAISATIVVCGVIFGVQKWMYDAKYKKLHDHARTTSNKLLNAISNKQIEEEMVAIDEVNAGGEAPSVREEHAIAGGQIVGANAL